MGCWQQPLLMPRMAHLGRDQVKPLRKISVSLLCEVFTSSSLSTKTFGFWLLRGVRAADRARCSMALIGQRILSCSAVPTAAALLPTAVSLAAPALAAFLAAAHWLHGVTFVEGGCVQCPGGPGAEPWSAGALATRCLRHGHLRCCVVCAQCSGLDACAWHLQGHYASLGGSLGLLRACCDCAAGFVVLHWF